MEHIVMLPVIYLCRAAARGMAGQHSQGSLTKFVRQQIFPCYLKGKCYEEMELSAIVNVC